MQLTHRWPQPPRQVVCHGPLLLRSPRRMSLCRQLLGKSCMLRSSRITEGQPHQQQNQPQIALTSQQPPPKLSEFCRRTQHKQQKLRLCRGDKLLAFCRRAQLLAFCQRAKHESQKWLSWPGPLKQMLAQPRHLRQNCQWLPVGSCQMLLNSMPQMTTTLLAMVTHQMKTSAFAQHMQLAFLCLLPVLLCTVRALANAAVFSQRVVATTATIVNSATLRTRSESPKIKRRKRREERTRYKHH